MENKKSNELSYDPETGKFRRICHFSLCTQPFWGRKDQLYCCRRCKNQVGNKNWRAKNPKLLEKEKAVRKNAEILRAFMEIHGAKKWLPISTLHALNFNGELYHTHKKGILKGNVPCDIIEIFELKLCSTATEVYVTTI
jgi:hypothetical protein